MRKMTLKELALQPPGVVFHYIDYEGEWFNIKGDTVYAPDTKLVSFKGRVLSADCWSWLPETLQMEERLFVEGELKYVNVLELEEVAQIVALFSGAVAPVDVTSAG
jgi:hypothetical protein